jgi:hypothetical protein
VSTDDLMAVGVLVLSVAATLWVGRRRSGRRSEPAGSHRPVGRGGSLDFVTAGRHVSRSNRRILPPARTTSARAHLRRLADPPQPASAGPVRAAPIPGGPHYAWPNPAEISG